MKMNSVIWIYVLLSTLFLSQTSVRSDFPPTDYLSITEKRNNSVDEIYQKMTFDQRINLLTVLSLENQMDDINSDSLNGYFSSNIELFPDTKESNFPTEFQNFPIGIYSEIKSESLAMSENTIGQTNKPKLAYYAQAINAEKLRKKRISVHLGNFFVTRSSRSPEEEKGFTASPSVSEPFWQSKLEGAAANGIRLGLNDPFLLDEKSGPMEMKDYLAIKLSGNRFYGRKYSGIIQVNGADSLVKKQIGIGLKQLSKTSYIRDEFDFDGILLGEDLSILNTFEQIEKSISEIKSGVDILCISAKNKYAIDSALRNHFTGRSTDLEKKCKKILEFKYELQQINDQKTELHLFEKQYEYQVKKAATIALKNKDKILPIRKFIDSAYYITSNEKKQFYSNELTHYLPNSSMQSIQVNASGYLIVDGIQLNLKTEIRMAEMKQLQQEGKLKTILITNQNVLVQNRTFDFSVFDAIILAADQSELSQQIALQALFGAHDVTGKLNNYVSPDFPMKTGVHLTNLNRLSYVNPKYIGIDEDKINEIAEIAEAGMDARAFPGCQVFVAVNGQVIYDQSFGYLDYSKEKSVDRQTIYDIASITKIAASTAGLMTLQNESKFSLDKTLGDYIPEIVGGTEFEHIVMRDMLAHQAGLPAWIPFYTKTLLSGKPNPAYYSLFATSEFSIPVAENLWLKTDYIKTIYERILSSDLGAKKYLYSDLGYYFVLKIIEKQSKKIMIDYLNETLYEPLGLRTMGFNPYQKMPLENIAPTEDDGSFRQQVVHGYVHDPGSAMMGGVGGHAGLFSNANDLGILMQMMLNNGNYGGKNYISSTILKEYTSVQFPNKNKRGAGFDKPNLNGSESTACALATPSSFGHSGFTGTLTWADPANGINYVFLSNRVHPNAENWKIVKMDIRTRIQTKIYNAVNSSRKFDFLQ